jgi:subtilisin family serine protease
MAVAGGTWPGLVRVAAAADSTAVSFTLPEDHRSWTEKTARDLVQAAGAQPFLDCIVTLREPLELRGAVASPGAPLRLRFHAETADTLEHDWGAGGLRVQRRYSHLPVLHVALPSALLPALAADARVEAVTPNRTVHALRTQGEALINVPAVAALGWDGSGIGIAILDSGVDYTHPELAPAGSKTIELFDAVNGSSDTMDLFGHGTSVAGIAAGSSGGVAPKATVVAVRVLDASGNGSSSQILAGVNAVIASVTGGDPYHIRVANMSFGGYDASAWPPNAGACDSVSSDFAAAFKALDAAGVLIAVAGGNGGCTTGVAWPACISYAMAIGAVYDMNLGSQTFTKLNCSPNQCTDLSSAPDTIECFSDSGLELSVWSPSHCSNTPTLGGGYDTCFGGTSASAPYVAGVAALLSQAVPNRNTTQLRSALERTGKPITDARNGVVRNRVDAAQALGVLSGSCAAPAAPSGLAANLTEACANQAISYTWSAVDGADTYELQTDLDPAFPNAQQISIHATNVTISRSSTSLSPLYARVRARAACGTASNFSSTMQVRYLGLCGGPDYAYVYYLSGAAHLPGVAPAFWYTDLAVLNPGNSVASVRLTFFGTALPAPVTANIPAHQQASWADVLTTLFALTANDVGVIEVESSAPVTVLSRNYSRPPADSGKTFGQSYDGQDPSRALIPSRTGYFANLRSDGQFRTNVEFVNVSAVEAGVTVQFFSSSGVSLGSPLVLNVGPSRRAAVTRALPAGAASAFAQINVSNPGAQVIGYASVIDGNSTDPTTVALAIP